MKYYVEISFCILQLAIYFSDPVLQNFIIYRTCYFTLGNNRTDCALLGTGYYDNVTTKLEKETQPYVTVINLTNSLMMAFLSTFMCFFLGSFSDKYGRRPVLIWALAGYTLSYVITTIIISIPNISPWFILLAAIPECLVGGFPIILASTICYITDTSMEENKGVRLGIFEASLVLAGMLGSTLSSFVFNTFGYVTVYAITTASIFVSFLMIVVLVPECIPNPELLQSHALKDVFKFSLLKETATRTFKRRPNNDRALLLFVAAIIVIYFLAVTADDGIVFLYLRTKLHWSLQHYTLYLSGRKVTYIFGTVVGIFILHKMLHINEGFLILLGIFSMMSSVLLQGIAFKNWHIYMGGAARCFGGIISPMTRSLVSKVVPTEDAGKVFSFIVICETLIRFVGSPIYTQIYNKTLNTMPAAFNFITVAIYGLELLLTIPVIVWQLKREAIENLNETLIR